MNSNDISRLSYKELQALALRYRVPGNIKKKLLVKVLQAAKGGNENEVGRLLQDLKQNRKRKVRKVKVGKLGLTSTPLHSPEYVMADDYYCPQQQPPYQWVGAEEEIASRDDDNRIPHYEEFKQFLLKRIQREFQTYDANNNQIQDPNIVDLRTAAVSSEVQKVPLDATTYNRPNIIAVNNADPFVYQPNDNVEYQTLEDTNSNVQGSIILKKMLQAPVGANLGEIASPVLGNYRLWTMEQYHSNNLLDNSDTLTAESDNQDNEENLDNNTECYGLLSGIKGEYFLNEPTFVKNVEDIGQHISNVLTNENINQYRYPTTNIDMNQDYESWTITNVMDTADNCTPDVQSSKIFQTMYYDNIPPDALNKPVNDESLTCQYRVAENIQSYNATQNLLNFNASEENQYYETNMIPNVQPDCNSTYCLQNLIKCSTETTGEYMQTTNSFSNANTDQDTYTSTVSQTFPNNSRYNSDLPYEYSCSHSNQGNIQLSENMEQTEQNCNSQIQVESSIYKNISGATEKVQVNGILNPFWPKKIPQLPSDSVLENILNFINTKRIDLSKLDQTSCVYCYIAPIVTHAPVSSSISCSQKERFVAEYRQHSFSPYWLLYNDTSCGMRMADLQTKIGDSMTEEPRELYTPSSNCNSNLRGSVGESEDSIPEVWTNHYAHYETVAEKDENICEDLHVEVTDCLFSVINTEPLVSQVDDLSKNQAQ